MKTHVLTCVDPAVGHVVRQGQDEGRLMSSTPIRRARNLLLAGPLLLGACGLDTSGPAAPTRPAAASSSAALPGQGSAPSRTTTLAALPSTSVSDPAAGVAPDPEAPDHPSPVPRPGRGAPDVALRSSSDDTLEWEDGLELEIIRKRQTTTAGRGPGSVPGRPEIVLTLEVRNHSSKRADVSQVIVYAPYGSAPRRLASVVYDDASFDFTGTLAPGSSSHAVYAFAVPHDARVDLVVDLDGVHTLGSLENIGP